MNRLISSLFLQTIGILSFCILLMIINRIFLKKGGEWNIAGMGTLLFIIINNVIGLFEDNWWNYIGFSFLATLSIFIILILFSKMISKLSYSKFGDKAMVFVIPFFYYPVIVLFAGFIKLIVSIVELMVV